MPGGYVGRRIFRHFRLSHFDLMSQTAAALDIHTDGLLRSSRAPLFPALASSGELLVLDGLALLPEEVQKPG